MTDKNELPPGWRTWQDSNDDDTESWWVVAPAGGGCPLEDYASSREAAAELAWTSFGIPKDKYIAMRDKSKEVRKVRMLLKQEHDLCVEYQLKLSDARRIAEDIASGTYIWTDTPEDELDTMGEQMLITITAGQLRGLLIKQRDELKAKISKSEAENSRLFALLNSMTSTHGRVAFHEAWVSDGKLRSALLISDDREGEEAAAHRIYDTIQMLLERASKANKDEAARAKPKDDFDERFPMSRLEVIAEAFARFCSESSECECDNPPAWVYWAQEMLGSEEALAIFHKNYRGEEVDAERDFVDTATERIEQLTRDRDYLYRLLHESTILSEGQIAARLGLDRVEVRKIFDEAEDPHA